MYKAVSCNAIQCIIVHYNATVFNTIQCNTMQCNAMHYNTIHCNAIQSSIMQYNTLQYNTIQCNTIQYNIIQCNVIQYSTVQYRQWRRKVPKSGGTHRHVIYVSSVKNNINELYLDIWLFNNSHLCQVNEIVHKIINWYMKNAK